MNLFIKTFIHLLFLIVSRNGFSQVKDSSIFIREKLAYEIRYIDINQDKSISKAEADSVFIHYLYNVNRELQEEIIYDVESVVIDLISYLENINCSNIKYTNGSKRFIELYYINKFHEKSINLN